MFKGTANITTKRPFRMQVNLYERIFNWFFYICGAIVLILHQLNDKWFLNIMHLYILNLSCERLIARFLRLQGRSVSSSARATAPQARRGHSG